MRCQPWLSRGDRALCTLRFSSDQRRSACAGKALRQPQERAPGRFADDNLCRGVDLASRPPGLESAIGAPHELTRRRDETASSRAASPVETNLSKERKQNKGQRPRPGKGRA